MSEAVITERWPSYAVLQHLESRGAALGATEVEIAGQKYVRTVRRHSDGSVSSDISIPPLEPLPETVKVSRLSSLANFIKSNIDKRDLSRYVVHVESVRSVRLIAPVAGRHQQREQLIQAVAIVPDLKFGHYLDLEEFRILLATNSQQTPTELLGKLAKVVKDTSVENADDGVSQRVNMSSGIATVERGRIENPVNLSLYRTFIEVDQPMVPYIVRLSGGGQQIIKAALFEADGGAWASAALESIAQYLADEFGDEGVTPTIIY